MSRRALTLVFDFSEQVVIKHIILVLAVKILVNSLSSDVSDVLRSVTIGMCFGFMVAETRYPCFSRYFQTLSVHLRG